MDDQLDFISQLDAPDRQRDPSVRSDGYPILYQCSYCNCCLLETEIDICNGLYDYLQKRNGPIRQFGFEMKRSHHVEFLPYLRFFLIQWNTTSDNSGYAEIVLRENHGYHVSDEDWVLLQMFAKEFQTVCSHPRDAFRSQMRVFARLLKSISIFHRGRSVKIFRGDLRFLPTTWCVCENPRPLTGHDLPAEEVRDWLPFWSRIKGEVNIYGPDVVGTFTRLAARWMFMDLADKYKEEWPPFSEEAEQEWLVDRIQGCLTQLAAVGESATCERMGPAA